MTFVKLAIRPISFEMASFTAELIGQIAKAIEFRLTRNLQSTEKSKLVLASLRYLKGLIRLTHFLDNYSLDPPTDEV